MGRLCHDSLSWRGTAALALLALAGGLWRWGRRSGEALVEFTFSFQARKKNPSFLGPVRKRPVVWEDPERGDMTRAITRRTFV